MDVFQVIRLNDEGIYNSLIEDVDINVLNKSGQNLLHEAITFRRNKFGLDLISRKINLNQQDKDGLTPLHYAASYNNAELAEAIIQSGGDPNICDVHGNNAVWTATFNARGEYKLVELLVRFGGDPLSKNKYDKSAIDFANQIQDALLISVLTH